MVMKMRCEMCGASQAKTRPIQWRGNTMRACTNVYKINVRTGEKRSCYDIYGTADEEELA